MMSTKELNLIREKIIKEVFVTSKDFRIIDGSGLNESSWLMDFRRVLLMPEILDSLSEVFLSSAEDKVGTSFQVGGIEVASIPIISGIVMKSFQRGKAVNGFFIRKSRKKTGLLNMIEGQIEDKTIVLVDDILNSGSSFLRQIEVIESLGKKVDVIMCILRFRDSSYYSEIEKRGIKIVSLFSLDDFSEFIPVKNLVPVEEKPVPHPFKVKWVFKSGGAHYEHVVPKSAPVLSDGIIYFGSDSGKFWALDAKTGEVRWSYRVLFGSQGKLIFSSPCVFKDTVFFGGYDGNFYALDKKTGLKKWVTFDADWIGSSPCVAGDLGLVYVGMEYGLWNKKGGITAYRIIDGKAAWHLISSDFTHGSPAYSKKNRIVVCGSNDNFVYGLNAKSGNIIWKYDTGGEVKAKCVFSPSEKYVAFGTFANKYIVLEASNGKLLREFETLGANYSNPTWADENTLIFSSLDKRIYAVNVKENKILWVFTTSARVMASPIVHEGRVYCGNNSARLYVIDLATGREVARHQVTERITNSIIIDGKTIYLPTFANEMLALESEQNI